MQARKITVVQTKNQKKSVVMTNATTLGELKEALTESGIDYEGMTFYEGLSKTELKQDSSILPHDIERNGTVTNELVFMLTNTDKKIRSGAMLRPELYTYIKTNNLQAEVQRKFGKNFTMCKTADLQWIVDNHMKGSKAAASIVSKEKVNTVQVAAPVHEETQHNECDCNGLNSAVVTLAEAVTRLVCMLEENNCLDEVDSSYIRDVLNPIVNGADATVERKAPVKDDMASPYSDDEIARMMYEM